MKTTKLDKVIEAIRKDRFITNEEIAAVMGYEGKYRTLSAMRLVKKLSIQKTVYSSHATRRELIVL